MEKKSLIISFVMALLLSVSCFLIGNVQLKTSDVVESEATTRTVSLSENAVDYQSLMELFDDAKMENNGNITTFEGTKTFNLLDFSELDLLSEGQVEEGPQMKVKYNYLYDYELNIITLSAEIIDEEGNPVIDSMYGVPYVDENGNLDCVFDCDGEYILLSELQDAGMIENCGWFKKLCKKVSSAVKKVTSTTIGKVGAVLTVAVPVVVGAVCAVVAAPVVAAVAIGAIAGAGIAAGTAAISTYQQDGKVDWETVGICAGVGGAVGAVASYSSYKIASAIKSMFPKAQPSADVKSFDSYEAFKKNYGKASDYIENGEWHHIVEQQTVTKGINGASSVYNSQNTVGISKNLHHEISKYYSSRYGTYSSFRQYVNTLPYEQQYAKGLEVLKLFAEKLGETIVWL